MNFKRSYYHTAYEDNSLSTSARITSNDLFYTRVLYSVSGDLSDLKDY